MNFLNLNRRSRSAAVAALVLTAALTFFVAAARPDAGNPILGTIKANIVSQTATTVTISVKGEWNWLSHDSDCNYDRAATGAGIMWGDRNGADYSRTITSIVRNNNVVTVTMPAHTFKVGERVMVSGVTNPSFNGGPFTITNASGTTIKYAQTGANATSSGGTVKDIDVFNGWLVYKSTTSNGYIGTKVTTPQNQIDREVHPTDIGNVPADGHGPLPGAPGQVLFDPGPNAVTGLGNHTTWKGGCGRQPVFPQPVSITSATESMPSKVVTLTLAAPGNAGMNVGDSITVAGVANNNYNGNYTITGVIGGNQITYLSGKSNLPASSGGTVTDNTLGPNQTGTGCIEWCGDPWGSWGYQAVPGYSAAFTHTYLRTLPDGSSGLPEKICVNFYDVHGGGTTPPSFQLVNGASEIQVDGNGDNSIETNAFNVLEGANCTSVIGSALSTTATSASAGGGIHDTAHLDVPAGTGGTLVFKVNGPRGLNTTTPDCSGSPTTLASVNVNGPGDYDSPTFIATQPGFYDWTVFYSGDPSKNVVATTSECGAPNETSKVTAKPTVTTDAGPTITLGSVPGTLVDSASLSGGFNPTGSITFTLFGPNNATCSGAAIFTSTVTVNGNGGYQSAPYTPTAAGTYRWIANYSGDSNNEPTANTCNAANENVIVERADSAIVTHQSFIPQDNATVSGTVTPTGNVTFELYKGNCSGSPVFSQTKALDAAGKAKTTNSGITPNGYTASGNGSWFWKVTYPGDASNLPSTSNCVEKFIITEP